MDIEPYHLDLARPLSTARGSIDEREGFLVRVEYADRVGLGEAAPLPGWTESLDACREALEWAPKLATDEDWGVALSETSAPAARHALALALADARAKLDNTPLYRYLGNERLVRRVPVNATVGDADAETTARSVIEAVENGFDCVKIKIGAREVDEDVERLRRVREVVGDDVALRADANGAWDREQAERAFDGLEALDLEYVEQPMPAEKVAAHAGLRNGGNEVPIALDESLAGRPVTDLLAAEAADYLVLKPMALGGPDRARNVARQARQAGVTPVISTTIDAVVARTAAVHVAAAIPEIPACGLATADWLADDLGPDPAPVADGQIEVPQAKGLGVDLGDE
ncbi:mandelate racemase/muconate lactonizing enzyme family protein [Halorientalis pallida]|uniref:o-succinylbenzoate synthase n=1 Tax=Halorientalis pallida TaxID=2479928 RepID=A0A498KWG1_9EURY|nr:o-succinylbenzoate synthase [Halorientalis pallida]RXK49557.1 o-succinylbenzoate synthase [Halorientalis pallida]